MDWNYFLVAVASGILIGAMSPRASFVIVARTAAATSLANGVAAALGMGLDRSLYATAAIPGLVIVLENVPVLFVVMKILGASYLFYLAARMWMATKEPLDF